MKIGVFDSGLGGLFLLRSMLSSKVLSNYDFVFLGDTKNLPYGDKTQKQIYKLITNAVRFLFEQDCKLIIIACNTASAQALRKLQQEYLPKNYPDRKVLGVIRPTVESVKSGDICVLATKSTVGAKAYTKELKKIHPDLKVTEIAAPELVQLIESANLSKLKQAIAKYAIAIKRTKAKNLILGCTHYALARQIFANSLPKSIKIISQDEIIGTKLITYLTQHPEIKSKLSKHHQRTFFITKLTSNFSTSSKQWFGNQIKLHEAVY